MNKEPLISIIVPVFNTEQYLRACLNSICNQTYKNIEIICVNDGSTDNSLSILREAAATDPRIVILNQKNSGTSIARNNALRHARGEWITGVDSDDIIEPDTYEYVMKDIEDDVDIILYGVKPVFVHGVPEDNNLVKFLKLPNNETVHPTFEQLTTDSDAFGGKLWRKSFIDKFERFFPEGLRYEDSYFWFTLAPYANKIVYRPEEKYLYIRRPGSFMSESSSKSSSVIDRIGIADAILEAYNKTPLPAEMQALPVWIFVILYHRTHNEIPDEYKDTLVRKGSEVTQKYANILTTWPNSFGEWNIPDAPTEISKLRQQYMAKKYSLTLEDNGFELTGTQVNKLKRQYLRYKILSKITWEKKRQKYKSKAKAIKQLLHRLHISEKTS